MVHQLQELFLNVESKYGGKEEGVVIKYNDKILKVQQVYQLDQEARAKIKEKFTLDFDDEIEYKKNVKNAALKIIKNINSGSLNERLKELSKAIKKFNPDFKNAKKNVVQICDDIQEVAKKLIIKSLEGNNGCLIPGRFLNITDYHKSIIKEALKNYDFVVLGVLNPKGDDFSLKEKNIKDLFKDIKIFKFTSASLITMLNKISLDLNINCVLCSKENFNDFKKVTDKIPGIETKEFSEKIPEDILKDF